MALRLSIELAADAVVVEGDDLTRFHVTDIFRSEYVECTGLTGYDITFSKFTDGKRMEAVFVTAGIYPDIRLLRTAVNGSHRWQVSHLKLAAYGLGTTRHGQYCWLSHTALVILAKGRI